MFGSRKKVCIFLILAGLIYMLFTIHERHGNSQTKSFTFTLHNTPYNKLINGNCSLQPDGKWNCPDIRTQGENKLRQSQLVLTRMLLIFDALAKKYNVRYWITRGTLLGAARHRGFIPWDIDLDIEMPIQDYLGFLRNGANELAEGMILQHHTNEQSLSLPKDGVDLHKVSQAILTPWNPRFRDNYSCYMTCVKEKCNWHDGLMIDIYPVVIQDGSFIDQFAMLKRRKWKGLFDTGYGFKYKAFPLDRLQFEGFEVPAPYEWQRQLQVTYGKNYMDLPPRDKQFPPDGLVPEPNISCPRPDQPVTW